MKFEIQTILTGNRRSSSISTIEGKWSESSDVIFKFKIVQKLKQSVLRFVNKPRFVDGFLRYEKYTNRVR